MTKEKHITILAILHIALSSITLLVAVFGFLILSGIGAVSGDETAFFVLGLIGTVGLLFLLALSLPGLIGGIGLLRHSAWARILILIVGFLELLNIPIGTALGIYTIWVLMDDEAEKLFKSGTSGQSLPAAQKQR